MDKLTEMLYLQRALQEETFGYDFTEMSIEERIQFIKDMSLAAIKEIGEALDETSWKPWYTGEPQINNKALTAELTDAFQFIMNMWFATQPRMPLVLMSDLMLTKLKTKLEINRERARTGIAEKCHHCGRALDDPAVDCTRDGDQGYCGHYHLDINYIKTSA